MISDVADYRIYIRRLTEQEGVISSSAKDEKAQSVYDKYYQYEEPVAKIAGHRVLALNRGEKEKFLTVKILAPKSGFCAIWKSRQSKRTTRTRRRC